MHLSSVIPSCPTKGCDCLICLSKGRYDETFAGEDGVIPANGTRESVFGNRNFPHRERGSSLGPLAPEASA